MKRRRKPTHKVKILKNPNNMIDLEKLKFGNLEKSWKNFIIKYHFLI